MYNRNLQPCGPPSQPGPPPQHNQIRLNEAFEIIRQEHDRLMSEMNMVRVGEQGRSSSVRTQPDPTSALRPRKRAQ
ncbi:hypothetical protein M378DRAFT_170268 [Amanita muscaria Koide BX008]|uniref:Uncharacterized protein n=1 Tax=Amanita muscaria (strain Koide BX008) TaxID=946122 RepID=A0A0C2WR01_AMAMK|nr:hypothetical protein M378DRAFT_170268 [Amanita muscaria Koide BX008]